MKPLILSLLASLLSLPLLSMPTPQEIAAAEPLVQEVMKAEMDALRSGKKTREQVGTRRLQRTQRGLTTKYTKYTKRFQRVEHVERVEGFSRKERKRRKELNHEIYEKTVNV